MLEEREISMQANSLPVVGSEIELVVERLEIKRESMDTTIIQLRGKLIREQVQDSHIVIAIHAKDELGQYIHLQQYEFDYAIDKVYVKEVDISVLVLSEINSHRKYDIEIKLLTEEAPQQWKAIQSYTRKI